MCIAIYKPKGAELLSKDMYQQCWDCNDDGASISYWCEQEKVWHVVKGLMSFDDYWKVYCEMRNDDRIGVDKQVFIHFRVGTAAAKFDKALTHPFPVWKDVQLEDLQQTMFASRNIIAHNGTIGAGNKEGTASDTMMAVLHYFEPMWDLVYYKNGTVRNEKLERILEECLDDSLSRWFVANGPKVKLYGPWIYDKLYDTHFSNTDYENPWWGFGGAYGWGGGYNDSTTYSEPITARFIRSGTISEFFFEDDGVEFDWSKWNSAQSGNHTETTTNNTQNVVDDEQGSDLIMAIIDENGNLIWNDEYDPDDDLLCCPDCASDDVFEEEGNHIYSHLCHDCGSMFDREGDTFGYKEEFTHTTIGECMYCNKERVSIEAGGNCYYCGAMLDLNEVKEGN